MITNVSSSDYFSGKDMGLKSVLVYHCHQVPQNSIEIRQLHDKTLLSSIDTVSFLQVIIFENFSLTLNNTLINLIVGSKMFSPI